MFRAIFAHHQERETEICTVYGNHMVTICSKNLTLTLLMMGKNCPKHVELI